jgi:murein DD-endopeptidase MepM/ murein hydrolase activator NlpD
VKLQGSDALACHQAIHVPSKVMRGSGVRIVMPVAKWLLTIALTTLACANEPPPPAVYLPVVRVPWLVKTNNKPPPAAASSDAPAPPDLVVPPAPSASSEPDTTSIGPLTGPLRALQLHNPMPGGIFAGYVGDTGLDLVGSPRPVHAIAAATVDYAEKGHTRWTGPKDSPYCVRLAFDQPIAWKGRKITHAYYAHLSAVAFEQAEGAKKKRHVAAGELLGTSGTARGVPHLHLGLLLDNEVEQDDWTFILREGEVRTVLGGYNNSEVLPKT